MSPHRLLECGPLMMPTALPANINNVRMWPPFKIDNLKFQGVDTVDSLRNDMTLVKKSHETELARVKKRMAALETENAGLKSGAIDPKDTPEIISVMGSMEETVPKVEFMFRDNIGSDELTELVNEHGWQVEKYELSNPMLETDWLKYQTGMKVSIVLKRTV
ncbi:MAG: hypothetical protein KAS32_27875 [Candidatus Peribacteraceae bacterium]|nr:hypothetical protein [Candidatus Peribacteraceae bacterium]